MGSNKRDRRRGRERNRKLLTEASVDRLVYLLGKHYRQMVVATFDPNNRLDVSCTGFPVGAAGHRAVKRFLTIVMDCVVDPDRLADSMGKREVSGKIYGGLDSSVLSAFTADELVSAIGSRFLGAAVATIKEDNSVHIYTHGSCSEDQGLSAFEFATKLLKEHPQEMVVHRGPSPDAPQQTVSYEAAPSAHSSLKGVDTESLIDELKLRHDSLVVVGVRKDRTTFLQFGGEADQDMGKSLLKHALREVNPLGL